MCLPIRRARTFAERNTATGVLLRRSELVTNAGRVLAPRHQQRGTISEEEPVFHIDEDVVQEERVEVKLALERRWRFLVSHGVPCYATGCWHAFTFHSGNILSVAFLDD